MHPSVRISIEKPRGCGYRKKGGIYLCSSGPAFPCGRLPIPLDCCPTCRAGIKPSRGWTWINGRAMVEHLECRSLECVRCPLGSPTERVGLLWVGEQFYDSPQAFDEEAALRGISRRIGSVPKGFSFLKTWVWLAHRKAITHAGGKHSPGVFRAFLPQRIEVIVTGDESDEEIEQLIDRGLSPVKVIRDVDHTPLFQEAQ